MYLVEQASESKTLSGKISLSLSLQAPPRMCSDTSLKA